jgi:aminomethyltransferase
VTDDPGQPLTRTPLFELHRSLGAKMVGYAGHEMPLHYPPGIIQEHLHTREQAGLFDVSHMGQVRLTGGQGHGSAAAALETLVPAELRTLPPGRLRYTQFTDDRGGILDDLMVSNAGDHLFLIVNAARKAADVAHLRAGLGAACEIELLSRRALLALQGPAAAAVLARLGVDCRELPFMSAGFREIDGAPCLVSRSGYTGEDGFEVSIPETHAADFARRLLAEPEVAPIGLGARDTLRLEAGLCLYGHAVIRRQLAEGVGRRRVGIRPQGRVPAREDCAVTDAEGRWIGAVTSGAYGPTVGGPIAMAYVETGQAALGTAVHTVVRGRPLPAEVAGLPFVPHRYYRG